MCRRKQAPPYKQAHHNASYAAYAAHCILLHSYKLNLYGSNIVNTTIRGHYAATGSTGSTCTMAIREYSVQSTG